MKLTKSEKQIESLILNWLNFQLGCFAFKVTSTGIYDPIKKYFRYNPNKGIADIVCSYYGYFVAFEVKKNEKEKLSPDQETFVYSVKNKGRGKAYKVWSLDQVQKIIGAIDNEQRKKVT